MFFLYYLRSVEKEFALAGSGSTFKAITKKHLEELSVPLPRLAEQQRIVAYLDAVQEKAKALQRAQVETDAELRRLEQSILAAALEQLPQGALEAVLQVPRSYVDHPLKWLLYAVRRPCSLQAQVLENTGRAYEVAVTRRTPETWLFRRRACTHGFGPV